jgi:hypothetical protein
LGFSSFFYRSFVDSNNNFYAAPTATATSSGTNARGLAYSYSVATLQTPNVAAWAKDHYACNSITGVELEDFGGGGTAGSHWDQRVILNIC